MERGSREKHSGWQAPDDGDITPRGARRHQESQPGGAGQPPDGSEDLAETEILSVGETLDQEKSVEATATPVPEAPLPAAETVPAVSDTTSTLSAAPPEVSPATIPTPTPESVAPTEPARSSRPSDRRAGQQQRNTERPRLTGQEDPKDLNQEDLYRLKGILGKTLTGDGLAAARIRVDAELHRRGDEVRSRLQPIAESEIVASNPDATSAEPAVPPIEVPHQASSVPNETPGPVVTVDTGGQPPSDQGPEIDPTAEPEDSGLTHLTEKRSAYAAALRSQSKIFFGRTSKEDLTQRREDYQATIAEEVQKKIEEVKTEFEGIPLDQAREAELNARITDLVLTHRSEEENSLVLAMKESADHSAIQRFQRFWKKSGKARLFIGIGLLGGGIAATLTGQFAVAAGLQALRVPMSGVGGTMTVESLAEMARSKFGKTGEIKSDQDIQALDDTELERRLAAHESSFVDTGGQKFGAKVRGVKLFGVGKKREDTTGERLLQEYQNRHAKGVKDMVTEYQDQGMTPDQIVAKVLESSLDEQRSHHSALEQRRASDRRFAIVKWTTAALGGAALATLSGLGALRQAGRAAEAGQDAAHGAGKAAGRIVKSIHDAHQSPHDSAHPDTSALAGKGWSGLDRPVRINVDEAMRGSVQPTESPDAGAVAHTTHAVASHDTSSASGYGPGQVEESIRQYHPDHGDGASPVAKSWGDLRMEDAIPRTPTPAEVASMQATKDAYEAQQAAEAAARVADTVETKQTAMEVVKRGDSIWKIVAHQLHERMGDKFDSLDEARQTYMIDALKDRVVEHHADFGLDNPDHLAVGQKLDLSHLFVGQEAPDLGHLHEHAVGLDQSAVDNINHHNEILREWVQAHPHEALQADTVLAADTASVAEQTAGNSAPMFSDHAQQIWVDKVSAGLRQHLLCDLAEKYPAEYAQAHVENPQLYPDVAGRDLSEQGELATSSNSEILAHIHLSADGIEAQKKFASTMKEFYRSTLRPDADGIIKQVNDMTAGEVLKKGVLEHRIDQLEGGTHEWAKKLAQAVQKLLKNIPAHEYAKSEKLKVIFARIQEVKGA